MFRALYVITQSGIPLYIYKPMDSKRDDDEAATLFSGLLSALLKFMVEVEVGNAKNFNTESYQVHISSAENHAIVLLTDANSSITGEDVKDLFDQATPEINLSLLDQGELMMASNEISNKLDKILKRLVPQWEKEIAKSEASKKLSKSLW